MKWTLSRAALVVALFSGASQLMIHADAPFTYQYRPGEQYRIVGVNRQRVLSDGALIAESEILTRIAIEVLTTERRDGRDGAVIRAEYQVSEEAESDGAPFTVDRAYDVEFWQGVDGQQIVPPGSFVPQVRDVPRFTTTDISVGDRWRAPAVEVYDFRDGLGIDEPVVVPVEVEYEYLGREERDGREMPVIGITYNLFFRPDARSEVGAYIRLMTARFDQRLVWDDLAGRAHFYEETYTLFMQTTDNQRLEYQGAADGRVVGAPPLDRNQVRDDIQTAITDSRIADTSVRADEEGVTISLENIRFEPDSAVLLPSEQSKLELVAEVLARYPERDILISGHTALAGTEAGRQRLSEERAEAVGRYLLSAGVRERDQIMFRGWGARRPVAGNDTEAGRSRNRRVEITILEN